MASMPIYEYRCGSCGERFEELTAADAAAPACRRCGAETERLLSAQAAPFGIVRSPGTMRKQEQRNAALQARAKARFKARRRQASRARSGGGDG
jgi:putative FmdB family regulatory protein